MIRRHLLIVFIILAQFSVFETQSVNGFGFLNVAEVFYHFEKITASFNITNECNNQIISVAEALRKYDEWALRIIDATAKPQSGLLKGNFMQIGNYDQCLSIQSSNGVKGKYCSVLYYPHEKYGGELNELIADVVMVGTNKIEQGQFITQSKMSYGFCVPKACTIADLQTIANHIEEELKFPIHFHFVGEFCDAGDALPFNTSAIIAIIVFGSFALIISSSTFYDVLFYQKLNEKTSTLYVSFSALSNAKRLLSEKTAEGTITCLNGLRVISMMWIVLGHHFEYNFFLPQINAADITVNTTESTFVVSASYAVDSFFVISGLLVVYLFFKSQEKGIKFSIPMFYLHRILRLTPSLVMIILFTATLVKYIGNGPFWLVVYELLQKPCERHWWSTLLYINNYVHSEEQCITQSWYLAVDTQMYFLSPLVLIPLARWPKATILAILAVVVLNCAYVFEVTWKKLFGTIFFDQDITRYNYIYIPTHVRGTAYLVGMVCGYFIFLTKTRSFKLSKLTLLFLWSCSLMILLAIILSHAHFLRSERVALEASFFNSLSRIGWSVALCMIILLCANGYGGLINSFLSSKIFTILIRLNYNIFLLHPLVIMFFTVQARTPIYFSYLGTLHSFWGNYIYSIAAAVVWTLSFESPILILEKCIFKKKNSATKNNC